MKLHQSVYKPLAAAGFICDRGTYRHPKAHLRLASVAPSKGRRAIVKVEGFDPDREQAKVLAKVIKTIQRENGGCFTFTEETDNG